MIQTKPSTPAYREGYDRTFGTPKADPRTCSHPKSARRYTKSPKQSWCDACLKVLPTVTK